MAWEAGSSRDIEGSEEVREAVERSIEGMALGIVSLDDTLTQR